MTRLWLKLLALALGAGSAIFAQNVQMRIYVEPAGSDFYVDGFKYTSSASFVWPKGSKHLVFAETIQGQQYTTKTNFQGWSDPKGLLTSAGSPYITVTADPEITELVGRFLVEHRIDVLFYNTTGNPTPSNGPAVACPAEPNFATGYVPGSFTSPAPGAVFVNGECFANSVSLWVPHASRLNLNAFPARGFVFEGWIINGAPASDAFLRTFEVKGPGVVAPRFSPAKRVIFQTEPWGLNISVDRTTIPTSEPITDHPTQIRPWELDFAEGSSHLLDAPSPQLDITGKYWVFVGFSNGQGPNTIYKAVGANIPETITARFVRGNSVSILTNPPGLKVSVDGRESWPSYNFVWGVGTRHTVSAPAETTDSKGRRYRFMGWVNGGPASQEIIIPPESDLGGLRLIANYELYPRVVIQSANPGMRLTVDGASCALPCTLDRAKGTVVQLEVAESVSTGPDSRFQFQGWSDSSTAARSLTFESDRTLTFRYQTFHRLTAIADPDGGADFQLDPPAADGFYTAGADVRITAVAREGYKFRRWDGDLSGTSAGGYLKMLGPCLVRALLDKTPHIPSAGVRNAVGPTPSAAVAPGSIISIFGQNLAADYATGPAAPLAQSVGNVMVQVGQSILPLLFVSPEQVNAFLPSGLPEGEHTITVRNGSQTPVSGRFQVAPLAPGIFVNYIEDRFYSMAVRPDGSAATPETPAKRGEQITLLGTGFGPYQRAILDGFPAGENPPNPVRLRPQILAGDAVLEVDSAVATPGIPGVVSIRFTVPSEWPAGAVELRIRQGEAESNKFFVAIQ